MSQFDKDLIPSETCQSSAIAKYAIGFTQKTRISKNIFVTSTSLNPSKKILALPPQARKIIYRYTIVSIVLGLIFLDYHDAQNGRWGMIDATI